MPDPFDIRSLPVGERPRHLHEAQIDQRMARSYYAVLHEDQAFTQALNTLFQVFQRLGFREVVAELFAREWPLPRRHGLKDLRWSYRRWNRGREPRLLAGPRFFPPQPTKRFPPQLVSPDARLKRARRLYRYVRLGWSYRRIADDEGVDIRAVVDSVRYWASHLGIPLRRRLRPAAL